MDELFGAERPFSEWKLLGPGAKPAHLFAECSSTHAYVRANLPTLFPGALVVADSQPSGHGRHRRAWVSPPGLNLSFNLLLPLHGIAPERWAQITQIAALELANLLAEAGVPVAVKWPNDLLWKKHKICGLISELLTCEGERLLSLGIGLNVNTQPEHFAGLDRLATSLKAIKGIHWNREALLQAFVDRFLKALELFRETGPAPWIEKWRRMDCFLGHQAKVVEGGSTIEGVIESIYDDGSLGFRCASGELRAIWSGDLEI